MRERWPHLDELIHNAPPMKRIGNGNDLTSAVVHLLGDAAPYTTGTDTAITGCLRVGRIDV